MKQLMENLCQYVLDYKLTAHLWAKNNRQGAPLILFHVHDV